MLKWKFLFLSAFLILTSNVGFGQYPTIQVEEIERLMAKGDSLLIAGEYEAASQNYWLAMYHVQIIESRYPLENRPDSVSLYLERKPALYSKTMQADSLVSIYITDSVRYERYINRAQVCLDQKNYNAAIIEYESALRVKPNDLKASMELNKLVTPKDADTLRQDEKGKILSLYSSSQRDVRIFDPLDTLYWSVDSSSFNGTVIQFPSVYKYYPIVKELQVKCHNYTHGILLSTHEYTCKAKNTIRVDTTTQRKILHLPVLEENDDWFCYLSSFETTEKNGLKKTISTFSPEGYVLSKQFEREEDGSDLYIEFNSAGDTMVLQIFKEELNSRYFKEYRFYPNGRIKTSIEETYKQEKVTGSYIEFSQSGDTLLFSLKNESEVILHQYFYFGNKKKVMKYILFPEEGEPIKNILNTDVIYLGERQKIVSQKDFVKLVFYWDFENIQIYFIPDINDPEDVHLVVYTYLSSFDAHNPKHVAKLYKRVQKISETKTN